MLLTKNPTASQHINLFVIHLKHTFFYKCSIDWNVQLQWSQTILFPSPRDINHLDNFGYQLGGQNFLSLDYNVAKSQPFV